jgi:hypothetical protein
VRHWKEKVIKVWESEGTSEKYYCGTGEAYIMEPSRVREKETSLFYEANLEERMYQKPFSKA